MFENCTIKYTQLDGINVCIRVIYPDNPDGSHRELSVPLEEKNTDYQNIQEWVAEGNTIQEAD